MAAMEKLCLNPGWNTPCNRNKISARVADWNFSPGWDSPCNQPLSICNSCNIGATKEVIKWRISARAEISARLAGRDFIPGSDWNPLEMKVAITWRRFLPELTFRYSGMKMLGSGWKAEKPHVFAAKFQPGLKREFEQAHRRNIQRNKMATMEKLCLNQGWNSPCNRNEISAR